jgi:hypothetical protein
MSVSVTSRTSYGCFSTRNLKRLAVSPIDGFIARLEGVRSTGPRKWLARCPAHDDRSPSLSLAEGDDGRVLIHCFSGCGVDAIAGAIGFSLSDLFPNRQSEWDHAPRSRSPFSAVDILRAAKAELQIVAVAACNLGNGCALTDEDRKRLLVAADRLAAAARAYV